MTTTIAGFTCGTCGTPIPWSGWHSCSNPSNDERAPGSCEPEALTTGGGKRLAGPAGLGQRLLSGYPERNDLMLNLETIPEHLRAWAERDLLPFVQNLEDGAREQAKLAVAAAQREVARVQAQVPALGEKAQQFLADAEKGLADAEALLQKLSGGM